MKKSRTEYSVINIGVGLAGYFLNTLAGFICRMVFVRCLPAAYLGINGLFTNILSMLSLAELGIGSAIIFALYKPLAEDDRDKVASLMKFYGSAYRVIGCVVAVVGLLLLPVLRGIIGDVPDIRENIYVIYLAFLFNTCLTYFFSYRGSLLTAAQRNYVQQGISYLTTVLQSIVQIVLLLVTKQYYLYLATQMLFTFAYNLMVSYKAKRDYPYIVGKNIKPLEKEEKRSLIRNVKALTVHKLTDLLVNSTDNIIITYFSGLIAVGAASNYTLLSGTLSTLTNQMFNALTASVGNLNATASEEQRFSFFETLQLANFWIFGWATLGIWFVSGDLVGLFFGEKFVLHQSIPFVLALNFYLVTMQSSVTTYRSTLGLFKYGQYTLIFTAILNLIFSIWLGSVWGLFGVYIATSFARILTNTWYIPFAVFKFGLKKSPWLYFKRFFGFTLLIAGEAAICYMLFSMFHFSYLINAILKAIVCSVLANGCLWLFFRNTSEFQYLKGKCNSLLARLTRH